MTTFSVSVPDNKAEFFNELVSNLKFAKVIRKDDFDLTEEHKVILNQRLENYRRDPESFLEWENVQQEIENQL